MRDAFGQPQRIVVLGGTSELALAVLHAMALDRVQCIVLAGRNEDALARAQAALLGAGAAAVQIVHLEATAPERASEVIAACVEAAGGQVDLVLVAVGMLGSQGDFDDDPAATAEAITVNLTWPAAALAALRPRLVAQGYGRVVVFSSVAGVRVRRANATYGATKAGLDGFALGYAESVRDAGVVVQVVRPGFVATKMTTGLTPPPMSTTPEVVAKIVVEAMAGTDLVVYAPRVLRPVFSIFKLLPQAVWRKLPG